MARVAIGLASPDRKQIDIEITRLRELDVDSLRATWRTVFRRKVSPSVPRHLLFRILAQRLQIQHLGDLAPDIQRVLEQSNTIANRTQPARDLPRIQSALKPGTVLTREWDGHMQHVMVLADGFSWKGTTYPSLSKVATAITGTRWNGPRFFGLRDASYLAAQS